MSVEEVGRWFFQYQGSFLLVRMRYRNFQKEGNTAFFYCYGNSLQVNSNKFGVGRVNFECNARISVNKKIGNIAKQHPGRLIIENEGAVSWADTWEDTKESIFEKKL